MRSVQILIGLLIVIGTSVVAGYGLSGLSEKAALGAGGSSEASETVPKDIFPDTGNRFPPVRREELDEFGKKIYDVRGVFGPGVRLHSPPVADYMGRLNDYLRRDSGLDPRLVQLAILVTAREMDSEYVWTSHEPQAQKAGLEQEIIDVVKYRKPLTKLGEKETVIIKLGRESLSKHKVDSDTFARGLKLFGNQGLINVVSLMGDYAATATLLNTADQHLRPGDKPRLSLP